jgi:outer membrane protein assembly factor BamB
LFSALAPMSIGYNSIISNEKEPLELDRMISDIAGLCMTPNGFNSVKYEYYKNQILNQYNSNSLNDNIIRTKDVSNSKFETLLESLRLLDPMDSAWPMKCHDTRHTSRSPYSTADNSYTEKWRFYSSGWVQESAIFNNDGIIYFAGAYGNLDYYLFAVYPNGTEKWKFKTNGSILSTPAIADDGTIYIGSWDGRFYAINPDGTRKWRFDAVETIRSSPVIGKDGIIYFGALGPGNYGRAYALYPNGTEKWHFDTGFWIYASLAIGDDGIIYVPSDDNYLYALYPNNGTMKWRYGLGDGTGTPSIAEDGTIFVSSYDGYLHALYPNGTRKWKAGIDGGTGKIPTIGKDGTIYIGKTNLCAINPNGTRKWTYKLEFGWEVTTAVAISAEDTIFFGITDLSSRADLVALNSDGTLKWRVEGISNNWVYSSPAIAEDGTVYIGTTWNFFGVFYAFGFGPIEVDANGPYFKLINEPVQFIGKSKGGYFPHSYHWDFGDTHTSDELNPIHMYTQPGNYTVTFTVIDKSGNTSTDKTYAWIQTSNTPPNKPNINGPSKGKFGTSYTYKFSSSDSDGSIIWYYVSWGDKINTGWLGPYDSGTEITKSHSWREKGFYIIKAKAKDPYNAESDWETFILTIPRTRASYNFNWLSLEERFPILQQLIQLLRQ